LVNVVQNVGKKLEYSFYVLFKVLRFVLRLENTGIYDSTSAKPTVFLRKIHAIRTDLLLVTYMILVLKTVKRHGK